MHPFWSPDQRRWISAGRLEPGDLVYTDKGTAVVEWYVMREKPVEAVCNIEVEGDHVYRVGESAVLVHNSSALSDAEVAHRVGGGDPGNLTLKPDETTLIPPGISVLIGGTPEQAAADMRRVFGSRSSMSRRARVVGTAEIRAIRAIGFDVMPDPTRNFPNHGRLYHPCGIEGFTPENLARLATVFVNTGDM